jgi:hypothetical protein
MVLSEVDIVAFDKPCVQNRGCEVGSDEECTVQVCAVQTKVASRNASPFRFLRSLHLIAHIIARNHPFIIHIIKGWHISNLLQSTILSDAHALRTKSYLTGLLSDDARR